MAKSQSKTKHSQTKTATPTENTPLHTLAVLPIEGEMSERTEGVFYNYEKQRNLETNHPNRNQYPFGHRHYAWIEFVPLSDELK